MNGSSTTSLYWIQTNVILWLLERQGINQTLWGRLTAPSQLKLAEYFPSWVFPKFLNPIKLKNKYYWFFVHTRGYKLQFDYDHLLITILH